ncbi:hypothetical protein [Arenibacterium sp. LLYu02]|uniref:hypothetical protein n=1 Tax=Arenibacterium sp. LLYu02 TaxID=3404132 RepID=UPI003B21489E
MQPDPSLPAPPVPDLLQDRLQQVAAREAALGLTTGFLTALLARIDETMLPRVVTLEVEGHRLARVELARRALVALDWHGHHWPSASATTARAAAPELAALLRALARSLPEGTPLSWHSTPATIRPSATQCTAALLKAALAPPRGPGLQPLLDRLRPIAIASARQTSTGPQHQDPASPWSAVLEATLAQAHPGTHKDTTLGSTPPSRACLRLLPLTADHMLALISAPDQQEALILSPDVARRLELDWQSLPL